MARFMQGPREIAAKYDSVCPETGKQIRRGDLCVYFPREKKAYHPDSKTACDWKAAAFDMAWEDRCSESCGL